MKIVIDLSAVMNVGILTGIQRVVRTIVPRLINNKSFEVILIQYIDEYKAHMIVSNDYFIEFALSDRVNWLHPPSYTYFDFNTLQADDIFFDIDSVWICAKRDPLYKQIKATGAKIVNYIYDIVPITHSPLYVQQLVLDFSSFIGAVLKYSDFIFSETQATLDEIKDLQKKVLVRPIPMARTWLGCDFTNDNLTIKDVPEKVASAIQSGKYLLQIGTVAPHKNHKLTLDAMDAGLFDKGLNYIIVGRIGWDCKDFEERVAKHPLLNKQLFLLEKVDNDSLKVLYKNAYALSFPSKMEGFGLPLIESVITGTPVFAGDIPVLREVGGEYAEYVDLEDATDFKNKVEKYLNNESLYNEWLEKVKSYPILTWDDVTKTIEDTLISTVKRKDYTLPENLDQIVYSVTDASELLDTLPFVEANMPFVKEIVILSSDNVSDEFKNNYNGSLNLVVVNTEAPLTITDNLYKLTAIPQIKESFIISSPTIRPIITLNVGDFINNGRCVVRNDSSTLTYSPQVISKQILSDIISQQDKCTLDDYLDYVKANCGHLFFFTESATISLKPPANPKQPIQETTEILFEDFDVDNYAANAIFAGLAPQYAENSTREAISKISRYTNYLSQKREAQAAYCSYRTCYNFVYKEIPYYKISLYDDRCDFVFPNFTLLSNKETTYLPIAVENHSSQQTIKYKWAMRNIHQVALKKGTIMTHSADDSTLFLALPPHLGNFRGIIKLTIQIGEKVFSKKFDILIGSNLI